MGTQRKVGEKVDPQTVQPAKAQRVVGTKRPRETGPPTKMARKGAVAPDLPPFVKTGPKTQPGPSQ